MFFGSSASIFETLDSLQKKFSKQQANLQSLASCFHCDNVSFLPEKKVYPFLLVSQ